MTAEYKVHGDLAVITLVNPPVNGLGLATRVAIADGLARANSDSAVKAIVLTGTGKFFSAGADITEFGKPPKPPGLTSLAGSTTAARRVATAPATRSLSAAAASTAAGTADPTARNFDATATPHDSPSADRATIEKVIDGPPSPACAFRTPSRS